MGMQLLYDRILSSTRDGWRRQQKNRAQRNRSEPVAHHRGALARDAHRISPGAGYPALA
jgi:hypothetical protein